MKMNKMSVVCAAVAAVCGAASASPTVSNVTLAQPAGTRLAVVEYEIDAPGITTFQFKTNGVDMSHSELVHTVRGGINTLLPAGAHTFTWDAGRDAPELFLTNLSVRVTAWETSDPPTYCAVSLVGEPFSFLWYGKASEVPLGVTHSFWKKNNLLMRKIPSTGGGTVQLGSPTGERGRSSAEDLRTVSFSQPFYMAVFEVTQRQWQNIAASLTNRPSYWNNAYDWEERPIDRVSYDMIRGATNDFPTVDWPTTGHYVEPESFMGLLREKAGHVLQFDLPTEAQWEYACRAGTTTAWNNGTTITSSDPDPNVDLLGRYQRNGGMVTNSAGAYVNAAQGVFASNGTAKVGSYLPNAWGIYDMHGNVSEWCLDWSINSVTDPTKVGADPTGPTNGTARVRHGGAWSSGTAAVRSANRTSGSPDSVGTNPTSYGIRIVAPAVLGAPPPPPLLPTLPAQGISAHRGENGVFPENTVIGFEEAVYLGAKQVEFDVRRTKDGHLVIMHDADVDRTTDGTGNVADMTLAEIRGLDAGVYRGGQFAGTQVPTLEEALDCLPRDIWINVHTPLSNPTDVAAVIIAKRRQHQAFIACGRTAALNVRAAYPQIMICNMERRNGDTSLYISETIAWGCEFIQLLELGTPTEMAALKSAGVRVNYFPAKTPQQFSDLVAAGVDFPLVDKTGDFVAIAQTLFGE